MTLVSVIIPAHNAERTIERCLRSVRDQTWSDIEIIVVDDGSTDGTNTICLAAADEDNRIKVVRQSNQGVSAARNAGLDVANGELVAFVDSDDRALPTMIESMVAAGADYVRCGFVPSDSGKPVIPAPVSGLSEERALLMLEEIPAYVWSMMFRASAIGAARFDTSLASKEDLVFAVQVTRNCDSLAIVSDFEYLYEVRPDSAVRDTTHKARNILSNLRAAGILLRGLEKGDSVTATELSRAHLGFLARSVLAAGAGRMLSKQEFVRLCARVRRSRDFGELRDAGGVHYALSPVVEIVRMGWSGLLWHGLGLLRPVYAVAERRGYFKR